MKMDGNLLNGWEDYLPTEEDVQSYEALGYFVAPECLSHELLDRVRVAMGEHQAGHRDRFLKTNDARFSDWSTSDGETVVRNNEFCSLQNDTVRELVMNPVIGAIAARLARSPAVRLFDDQLVYKPPSDSSAKDTVVGWHTDGSYWSTCTSDRMLTAWIPLHDTSVENGTLHVVAGSHLWPESDHVRGFNDPDLESLTDRIGRQVSKDLIHPILLKKGQFSFHHMRTLHGSTPNMADFPRCAVALHMQDDSNCYQQFRTTDGTKIEIPHDRLCRVGADGNPDYRDPAVFPQIWPA